jgi:heme-degrading monooxygenase HmoA
MKSNIVARIGFGISLLMCIGMLLMTGRLAPHAAIAMSQDAQPIPQKLVARIWHGRVRTERADEYNAYLQKEGVAKIEAIPGNLGAQVLRRTEGKVTEFMVISYWPSRDAIHAFAGADIEKTHNLPKDKEFLLELEPRVRHFDVVYDSRKSADKP